jgi:crossover junction endodeoxyribonuclease RusA
MPDPVSFRLPIPPSTNNLYFNVRGRGRVKTPRYRRWITDAGWAMKRQHMPLPRFPAAFEITISLPAKARMDRDNLKAIPDLLKSMGIIVNDDRRHMVEYRVVEQDECAEVVVELREKGKSDGKQHTA